MKSVIRNLKKIGVSILAASINKGDYVRVTNLNAAAPNKNQAKILKNMLKKGNGKALVVTVEGDYANLAADEFDALLGTVKVPIAYITKVK